MKKLKPHEVKGKEAEERFIALARSLKRGHPWLGHVRKAGVKHDHAGVDVIIYAYTITGSKEKVLPIALQVKSSQAGVRKFYRKHSDAHDTGVVPIVVNERRSDRVILRDIARAISRGLFVRGRAERVASFLSQVRQSHYARKK